MRRADVRGITQPRRPKGEVWDRACPGRRSWGGSSARERNRSGAVLKGRDHHSARLGRQGDGVADDIRHDRGDEVERRLRRNVVEIVVHAVGEGLSGSREHGRARSEAFRVEFGQCPTIHLDLDSRLDVGGIVAIDRGVGIALRFTRSKEGAFLDGILEGDRREVRAAEIDGTGYQEKQDRKDDGELDEALAAASARTPAGRSARIGEGDCARGCPVSFPRHHMGRTLRLTLHEVRVFRRRRCSPDEHARYIRRHVSAHNPTLPVRTAHFGLGADALRRDDQRHLGPATKGAADPD